MKTLALFFSIVQKSLYAWPVRRDTTYTTHKSILRHAFCPSTHSTYTHIHFYRYYFAFVYIHYSRGCVSVHVFSLHIVSPSGCSLTHIKNITRCNLRLCMNQLSGRAQLGHATLYHFSGFTFLSICPCIVRCFFSLLDFMAPHTLPTIAQILKWDYMFGLLA